MDKKKMPGWLVLTIIVVVAGVALGVAYAMTEQPINDRNLEQAQGALKSFFPDADSFEPINLPENSGLDFAYTARKGSETLGYAAKSTAQGYGGPIEVVTGMATDGSLKGISVGGTEFKETEGLGSKAKEPSFTDQFAGQKPPLTLGTEIDAISGATVTSKAVVGAVNTAADALAGAAGMSGAAASGTMRVANASVMSYSGPVLVNLKLDESGAIVEMEIGKERFMENADYGAKVKDPAFIQQFIGKKPPLELGKDVDAVSGATGSSQTVVDAVNAACAFAQ